MADHAFNTVVVTVGGGFGVSEDVFGVEDVEPLVLHRTHVEVGHGNDVEQVEIILAAEDLLVPFHRALEALHRVLGAVEVAFADPDVQFDLAAAHGGEAVRAGDEVAGDEREEV